MKRPNNAPVHANREQELARAMDTSGRATPKGVQPNPNRMPKRKQKRR